MTGTAIAGRRAEPCRVAPREWIQMHLVPPLHPAATSLEVIVTGASGRVRATVPLHWQAAS